MDTNLMIWATAVPVAALDKSRSVNPPSCNPPPKVYLPAESFGVMLDHLSKRRVFRVFQKLR
jgi:hypothetical protein